MAGILAQATFRWDFIINNLPLLLRGVRVTLFLAVTSFLLAIAGGIVLALARRSRLRVVGAIAGGYINVLRAVPLLVFIVFIYYGMPQALALDLSDIQAGVLALSLQYSAWLGEIFRAGIQAIPGGQREAALSVGMGRVRTFFSIVLPQAARISLPPTGNMLIGIIKDSSLVYIIGTGELFRVANILANRTFRYFETYLAVLLIYLVLTLGVYYLVKYLERRYTVVDVLAASGRQWSPFKRRKLARLRELQESVRGGATAAT